MEIIKTTDGAYICEHDKMTFIFKRFDLIKDKHSEIVGSYIDHTGETRTVIDGSHYHCLIKRVLNPDDLICPICNKKMIPHRMDNHDSSGIVFGWLCDCNDILRDTQINKG